MSYKETGFLDIKDADDSQIAEDLLIDTLGEYSDDLEYSRDLKERISQEIYDRNLPL